MTDPASATPKVPARARVVIIGGGVIGTSVAYHLTQLGWTDVVLLEQGRLACGTTWHAAGLVGQLRATESGTRLVQYSSQLYQRLEAEVGLSTGYRRRGGVTVARTPERLTHLQRTAATARAYDLECELISPSQARELFPLLNTDDLLGALWLPGDGTANPTDVTQALARGARLGGARILEGVRVTGVATEPGPHRPVVTGVLTDAGPIEAEIVVNCAGQWAKAVGAMAGVGVPLHSAEHFYVVTEPMDGVVPSLPVLRDPDGYTYIKEEVGGLVVGGFEPVAKPWVPPEDLPYPFEFQLLEEDWEHFEVLMDSAINRIPALETTGIRKFYNGPESFTPDNQFVMGESAQVRNFFVGAGFNSVGIASAGGAGRALAEWIVAGEPPMDMAAVDIRRFADFNANSTWLRDRVGEVLGLHYAIPWPNRELSTARPFRCSPVHHLLSQAGAVFGSRMGWERPNVFAPAGESPQLHYSWEKPHWVPWSAAEQRATRTQVAVFDQTSFAKLEVSGPDALSTLQWLCTADVDVPAGQVVYTGMLNRRGTYESDLTVTRTGEQEFLLVTSSASAVRDADQIRSHLSPQARVQIRDVTTQYAVFGVMGPASAALLSSLSRTSFSDEDFAFATSRVADLGYAQVRAARMTYVGELGWELYVPTEFATGVYQQLIQAGAGLGVRNAGYYSIESLRLEKGYRAFGRELTGDYFPHEAGLLFTCKLNSSVDFLGREAMLAARAAGWSRRLVSLVLNDPEAMLWGGELMLRNGEPIGQVTSAAWGATVGASVGLAYLNRPQDDVVLDRAWIEGGDYQVRVGAELVPARVTLKAPLA